MNRLFRILLAVACIWPVILLLVEHPWNSLYGGYSSSLFPWITWLISLIDFQACFLLAIFRRSKEEYKGFWHEFRDPYRLTFSILLLVSFFLAPFWIEEMMNEKIDHWLVYLLCLVISGMLHIVPLVALAIALRIPDWLEKNSSLGGGYYYADLDSNNDSHEDPGHGTTKGESWLDSMSMTKNYYGMHGEFDRNDEARRISEDMQQFHYNHPDADLSDHYYWDDVLDAETDGYLDD